MRRTLAITVPILFALLATSPLQARPSVPRLSVDSKIATAGYYRLNWEPEAASFELQESNEPGFLETTTTYTGPDRAAVISGKPNGTWYYRVRTAAVSQPGPWSRPVAVTVAHHNLSRAVMFLSLGLIVFFAIVAVIIRGEEAE